MRFKSVLGAMVFIVLASFLALGVFVQTRTFGRILSKVVTDLAERKAATKVTLGSIGISFFPPGIELNRVRVEKVFSPEKQFKSEFGRLGFYIGLIEFEEKKLTLGEIRISDSVIDVRVPDDKSEPIKELDPKLIDLVFSADDHLPVRVDTILVENSRVIVNHELIEAKRLKLFKRSDAFLTRFHLANLRPLADRDLSLDEIWGDAEIGKKNVSIHRLRVQHDVHTLLLKGKIKNYPALLRAEAAFAGESTVYLRNLENIVPLPGGISTKAGFAHLNFNLKVKDEKISGTSDVALNGLKSNIIYAEQIIASLAMENGVLRLNSFDFSHKKQKLHLLNTPEVLNLNTGKFLYQPLVASAEKLRLGNAIRFLPALKPIKGILSGELSFFHDNGNYYFAPKDGFVIQNLGLVVGDDDPFKVLMIKRAKLTDASLRIVGKEFQLDSVFELPNSVLDVHGYVNAKSVGFDVKNGVVDLQDFGNIAKLDIKGKGNLDIKVSGPLDDVVINLRGLTEGFEVLGYRLGKADKDISVELKDSNVVIHRMEAVMRNTPLSGTGVINYANSDIALGINSQKATFGDLRDILAPIFSKITFLPEDLDLLAKVDANIFGKTAVEKLKIKAGVRFTDMVAYGENISSGDFDVKMEDRILQIRDLSAVKGKGSLRGDFSINLANDRLKMAYEWDELLLSSFNIAKKLKLNLNGVLSGSLVGEGTAKDYDLHLLTRIDETRTSEYKFQDSNIDLRISPARVAGDLALLGSIIRSKFDYSIDHTRPSSVKLAVDAPEIKPFAAAFLGQHIEGENFSGNLKLNLDTSFKWGFKDMNLTGTLAALNFRNDNFNVTYRSSEPQFVIDGDRVKVWDLRISEPDLQITSRGSGTFGQQVQLVQDCTFNARIFELLLAPVLSSEGVIKNSVKIEGAGEKYAFTVSSSTSNLDLSLDGVPFPLNALSYGIEFTNNRLYIQELKTSLENGSVLIKGDVFLDEGAPDVNIKYVFDRAEIPILGKSVVNITGEGIILGNETPYNVGGEITVNKAQVVNELTEFGQKSSAVSQVRFLPQNQESPLDKLFNLNVNVKLENPARITNSLMDVSLKGEVRLLGSPSRPRGEGRIFAPVNSSRIFFKNNEYYITNADLNFTPRKEITNPDFDVQSLTMISNYKVYAKAYGDLERFNFDLTSDPSLPRNSILSLIAFGYTDDIQNSLRQQDQQNLTQVGVGSFVFDRFKISDILNKQFGLQVNLGTVFDQSQDSMISGRGTGDQPGALGRTRSATKIELRKRLDEALTLSVSSTMGGSIGQQQSMNLNYSINKKVQLEGVYQKRTNEDGTTDVVDDSLGFDFKFRKTFK